ncbi:hypothetical protein XELAEV_18008200mg [Xenopus laevis]|uniref:Uncharacterized protein n=1 Tax=Xenopus laevis TaxID=8355 RepID=A0A974E330_XENLA|nr:hypothetical protein XELAEV_18008200mg [Xenopus laevis]
MSLTGPDQWLRAALSLQSGVSIACICAPSSSPCFLRHCVRVSERCSERLAEGWLLLPVSCC